MSLKIENLAVDAAVLNAANIIEDLAAAKRHKIGADNPKARILLARWARDKKEQLDALLDGVLQVTPDVRVSIEAAISGLRKERSNVARVIRERREQHEAERAALLGELAAAA